MVATECVELLDALVAMPTIAGTANGALINHVAQRLRARGVRSEVVSSHTRADGLNLHAVIGPAGEPDGVILAAHTDVVPVEGQRWSTDPFVMTRVGDRLFGRGTTDMKGFVAAAVCAAERAVDRPLHRPLHLALSCDEELGCAGVGSLLDALAAGATPAALCIVGEPTRLLVADRHKGKVRLRVDVRGRAVHSAAAPTGVNAVTYAARLVAALDQIARRLDEDSADAAFAVPHATLSIGPISGGVSTNIVPDACRFEFELRYLPGQDSGAILAQARAQAAALEAEMRRVAPECAIQFCELAAYPPLAPPDGGVVASQWWPEPSDSVDGGPLAVDFGTEAGLYRERLGVPTIICGPGDMARAHRADEYIELDELQAAERWLARVVDRLCRD